MDWQVKVIECGPYSLRKVIVDGKGKWNANFNLTKWMGSYDSLTEAKAACEEHLMERKKIEEARKAKEESVQWEDPP